MVVGLGKTEQVLENSITQGLFDPAALTEDQSAPGIPEKKNQSGRPEDQEDIFKKPLGRALFGRQGIDRPFDKPGDRELKEIHGQKKHDARGQGKHSLTQIRQEDSVGSHEGLGGSLIQIFMKSR
jgi:hypothetical protein